MTEFTPDSVLRNRYCVRRVIAHGGMGTLYEAFDQDLERRVALKQNGTLLAPELFRIEARLLARLHHPNLPAAIDTFEENGEQFLVMEYIEGRNLDQLLIERGRFSINEVGPWALQILDALAYLHTREPPVIHRDLKPSNLILDGDTIFLIDFGISKDNQHTKLPGSGTMIYASPEHIYGSTTVESDLFSLAATLYHLLTGMPAYPTEARVRETRQGRRDPYVPAHIAEPLVGQAVSAVLTKGMRLDPAERYRTAPEMRAALTQALGTVERLDADSERTTVTQAGWRQPGEASPARPRGRSLWLLMAIPALLLTLLGGWAATQWLVPPTAPAPRAEPTDGSVGVAPAATASLTAASPVGAVAGGPPESAPPPTEEPQPATAMAGEEGAALAASPTPPPPTATAPAPAEAPAAQAPTPLPQAPPNTIRIALQSPMSGEWGDLGTGIGNAGVLAAEQKRAPLTRLGFNLELVLYDDRGVPEQGKANAETIVADPSVLCVVGHFNSGVSLAAQTLYGPAGLVQISPGSTNPAVTEDTDNVWRVVGRDDVQGTVAAQFSREALQARRVFIIHDGTPYGLGIASVFQSDAQANGQSVEAFEAYDDTPDAEVDFAPLLEKVQAVNPDLIYFAGSYSRAGVFFREARERGVGAQFLGSDSLDNPGLAALGGAAVDGMHFTTVAAPPAAFPQAGQFIQDYRARFAQEAPPFSPEGYDAVDLCVQAIARAARANGGLPSREQVLAAMRTLTQREPFQGISGNYTFNENGDPRSISYFVIRVNAANWGANQVVQRIDQRVAR